MQEAIVYVVWDETGEHAAHTDADEAAALLEEKSSGKFRRFVELNLCLPPSAALEMRVTVDEQDTRSAVVAELAQDDPKA